MSIALCFPLFLLSLTKFFRFGILSMVRTIPSRLRRHLSLQSRPQQTPLRCIRRIRHNHIRILLPISVHWTVPVIAAALYLPGIFLTFQSIWYICLFRIRSIPGRCWRVMISLGVFRPCYESYFAFWYFWGVGHRWRACSRYLVLRSSGILVLIRDLHCSPGFRYWWCIYTSWVSQHSFL